jgi:Plant transposon protein
MDDLEESLKRGKRNRMTWNMLQKNVEEIQTEERQELSVFRNRRVYKRESFKDSFWYIFMLRDLTDLTSRDGKNFRLRFTVPYQVYTQLLSYAEAWFPQTPFDICGRERTPIFLKLLGTLRMLGKGCSWDLLYELSGISLEVHRRWTHAFLAKFSKELYPVYVHGPRNAEELNKVTTLYAASGFPGCVGSTDCVHIRWDQCPAPWLSVFRNGKNSFASIAYEMTVDHTKRFQATTIGHYGTTSDKTIVKFDGFVNQVRFDALYTEAEYKLQVGENLWVIEKGVYLLVDGGYHKWRIMQCPLKHSVVEEETRWSEFAESVRKDVECSFGILKKRFQILKNAITWHSKSDIDNAVFSCVILHNMLHEYDGYDERWEAEIYNKHNDEEEQLFLNKIRRRVVRTLENNLDNSKVGHLDFNLNNLRKYRRRSR